MNAIIFSGHAQWHHWRRRLLLNVLSVCLLMLAFLLGVTANVLTADEPDEDPSWHFTRVRDVLSIKSLPRSVYAPDGRLTLFADYAHARNNHILLYLVNRTDRFIAFHSQDDDPYVRLEGSAGNGRWQRAEVHRPSGCGNSYYPTAILRPDTYFMFTGFYPSDGETRLVRYRMLQQNALLFECDASDDHSRWRSHDRPELPIHLISNVGVGKVRAIDITASQNDGYAMSDGSFELIRDYALGTRLGEMGDSRRSAAIESLSRFPTQSSLELLIKFSVDPDREISLAAMRGLSTLGQTFAPAESAYQDYLKSDNPQMRAAAIMALQVRPLTPEIFLYAKGQLLHHDRWVRSLSLSAIAQHCNSDPEIKEFVNALYDDPDPKIQSIFETFLFPTCINYGERGYKDRSKE